MRHTLCVRWLRLFSHPALPIHTKTNTPQVSNPLEYNSCTLFFLLSFHTWWNVVHVLWIQGLYFHTCALTHKQKEPWLFSLLFMSHVALLCQSGRSSVAVGVTNKTWFKRSASLFLISLCLVSGFWTACVFIFPLIPHVVHSNPWYSLLLSIIKRTGSYCSLFHIMSHHFLYTYAFSRQGGNNMIIVLLLILLFLQHQIPEKKRKKHVFPSLASWYQVSHLMMIIIPPLLPFSSFIVEKMETGLQKIPIDNWFPVPFPHIQSHFLILGLLDSQWTTRQLFRNLCLYDLFPVVTHMETMF